MQLKVAKKANFCVHSFGSPDNFLQFLPSQRIWGDSEVEEELYLKKKMQSQKG